MNTTVKKANSQISTNDIQNLGILDYSEPVDNIAPLDESQIDRMMEQLKDYVSDNKTVGVSCVSGLEWEK